MAGALTATGWRSLLEEAGLTHVEMLGPTGYRTSRYTRAECWRARRPARQGEG